MDRITAAMHKHESLLEASDQQAATIEDLVRRAIRFLADLDGLYEQATNRIRRTLNQGMWTGIYIKDVGAGPASIAEPFRTLLDPDLVVDLKANAPSQARPASWAGGMPTWLRQHEWWDSVSRGRRSHRDHTGGGLGLSLGLGLNKVHLAPPTGFEPVLPP